jgi:hypothetical protein
MAIDSQVLDKIYRAKEERRRELARRPFHEKIEMLVTMQRRADGILRSRGLPGRVVWKLPSGS